MASNVQKNNTSGQVHIKDNLVQKNEILKAQVFLEEKARKEWFKKWGFYLDFDKIFHEKLVESGITIERFKELTEARKPPRQMEEFIWEMKPTKSVPVKSSGFIGWRSEACHSLEKMGPLHINPVLTLPPPERATMIVLL